MLATRTSAVPFRLATSTARALEPVHQVASASGTDTNRSSVSTRFLARNSTHFIKSGYRAYDGSSANIRRIPAQGGVLVAAASDSSGCGVGVEILHSIADAIGWDAGGGDGACGGGGGAGGGSECVGVDAAVFGAKAGDVAVSKLRT